MDEPAKTVAAGYDRIAQRYLEWSGEVRGDPRPRFTRELTDRLPTRPAVLDLGCGAGVPSTAALAEVGDVVGVDVSTTQLELARRRVPSARFVRGDMSTAEFPASSFDAVTAFYSIAHVPRDRHAGLFTRIAGWLRPGGHFLAALGSGAEHGTADDWLGAPMFFSSHDAQTNSRLLAEAGLTTVLDELVTIDEPEGPVTFQWVLVRKPA